jgi:hypothetical protein
MQADSNMKYRGTLLKAKELLIHNAYALQLQGARNIYTLKQGSVQHSCGTGILKYKLTWAGYMATCIVC